MSLIYNGISKITGPLIFIKNTFDITNEEIVKITGPRDEIRHGQVLEIVNDVVCIEVFEGTQDLSLGETRVEFLKDTYKIGVSEDMFGRVFNGLGHPVDLFNQINQDEPSIVPEVELNITGDPMNPYAREYPHEVIVTGISAIDGLNTFIRGQKLPIFSGQGLPHNKLAAQIVNQAHVLSKEPFLIVFCGIGILQDDALFFLRSFEKSVNVQNVISFINLAKDPTIERLLTPRIALTAAEYFAFVKGMQVLTILIDMTNYAEALREISASKGEIPSRKGFPGYLYSDLASLYERAGRIKGNPGSITLIPILTMPNDDITHPIPDLTGYITEGQVVLSRGLFQKGIYPPVEILSSISRLMKDSIGARKTRADHPDVYSQLYSLYSDALDLRELESIIGRDSLSPVNQQVLEFGHTFERQFLHQRDDESRDVEETLTIAWNLLSRIPRKKLIRVGKAHLDQYHNPGEADE